MKKFGSILIVSWMLGTLVCQAQAPADNNIKGALIDIQKYESQFAGKTSVNPSTVKRTLKLLTITRQRLDGSPNKSHASWVNADNRYNALVGQLNQLLSGGSSSSAAAAPRAPAPAPAARQTATRSSGNTPKHMISQYRVRIKKITRDIESRKQTMDQGGVKPFQDPNYVAKFEQSGKSFQASIDKYADYRGDPDVEAAVQKLAEYNNMITFGKNHAAKELAELGNVQAKLAAMEKAWRSLKLPDTPQEPYGQGTLQRWLTELATIRQTAAKTYEPLPQIKERAYLPVNRATVSQGGAYDWNDLIRIENGLKDLANKIDNGLKQFTTDIDHKMDFLDKNLYFYDEYDPTDRNDQTNHFLGEGRADEIRDRLAKDLGTAQEAANYAKLLKHDTYDARVALVNKVQGIINRYEANYQKARELVRMPEAATKDSKLTKIARETLAKYDSVGDIKRMVINTEKVHRSKETSEEKYDDIDVSLSGTVTLTGTKTTYFYEWDQFQVATAEPVGDKHYIFYNTLKYFTSGASTTPLNKWIMSGRLQSSEIPEANINK